MTSKEKEMFATEAGKALAHPLFIGAMEEAVGNLQQFVMRKELVEYIVMKIGTYAAQIARAQALGIDPDSLRITPEESNQQLLRITSQCPQVIVILGDSDL